MALQMSSVRVPVDVAVQAGSSDTGAHLLEQPVATALAAGMNILSPSGNMIVDVGGGITEVAIVSLGGVVTSRSIKIAGDTMDEEIVKYVHREFNLVIGEKQQSRLKFVWQTHISILTWKKNAWR